MDDEPLCAGGTRKPDYHALVHDLGEYVQAIAATRNHDVARKAQDKIRSYDLTDEQKGCLCSFVSDAQTWYRERMIEEYRRRKARVEVVYDFLFCSGLGGTAGWLIFAVTEGDGSPYIILGTVAGLGFAIMKTFHDRNMGLRSPSAKDFANEYHFLRKETVERLEQLEKRIMIIER